MRLGGQGWHLRSQRRGQSTDTQDTTTDRTNSVVFLGSSGISGKHGVRCKEGYDPWIVRLGPAEESDTLMKARTRRGHDGHDRTKQRLCLLSGLLPVPPASQSLVCFRWPFHAAFPGNSGRTFFIGAVSLVSRFVRVMMSVAGRLSRASPGRGHGSRFVTATRRILIEPTLGICAWTGRAGIYAHKDADKALTHKTRQRNQQILWFLCPCRAPCVLLCPRLYERRCQFSRGSETRYGS